MVLLVGHRGAWSGSDKKLLRAGNSHNVEYPFGKVIPQRSSWYSSAPASPPYQNPRVMFQDEHVLSYTRRDVQSGRGAAQANTPSPSADDQSPDAPGASVPDVTEDTTMMVENEVLEKEVGQPDDEERESDGAEQEERGQRGQPEAGEAIGMVAEESEEEEEEEGDCVVGDASEDQNDGDDEKSGDEVCPGESKSNVSEPEEGDALDESSEPEPEVEVYPKAAPVSVQEGNEPSPSEVRQCGVCVAG